MAERRLVPGHLAGGLLLLASGVLAASAVPGAPSMLATAGFTLLATAAAVLGDLHLRARRFGTLFVLLLFVAIGDRLAEQSTPLDRPWALPVAFGGYLVWTALTATPRAVVKALAP